jgi:hypothetical protein
VPAPLGLSCLEARTLHRIGPGDSRSTCATVAPRPDRFHACTDTTNDPRVNGSHVATWNMDVWGDITQSTAAGVQWGTVRIENGLGTWEGRFSGVASLPQPGDTIAEWYRGTGDYEGLAYFESVTGVCCTYVIRGRSSPATLRRGRRGLRSGRA